MIVSAAGPHIADHGRWTLGVLIGLPFCGLAVLVALAVVGFGIWMMFNDEPLWGAATVAGTLVGTAVLAVLVIFLGYWPLSSSYHQYREVDGTVSQVSSRLVAGDKSTNQKFIVTLDGSTQQFGVDDTRAALLKPGDAVTLSCIKSYQYGAQFGYDCNWGKP
jgi:hypothetical protein